MTPGRGVGTFQGIAAAGIVAWWVYWFASGKWSSTEPIADRWYENAFPVPDLTFAALLVVCALAWHGRLPLRLAGLGLLAGGMGLALAAVDTLHNVLTGAFEHASVGTLVQKLLFAVVNSTVGALSVAVTWRRREALGLRDLPVPRDLWFIGGSTAIALAYAGWTWVRPGDPDLQPLLHSTVAPAGLAAAVFGSAVFVRGYAWPLLLAVCGHLLHLSLLVLAASVQHPGHIAPIEPIMHATILFAVLLAGVPALRDLLGPAR